MMVTFTKWLALNAVFIVLTSGAREVRVWKAGPQIEPDVKQRKAAGFRSVEGLPSVAISVHCTDKSMVVRGHADLYGTGRLVPASELRLGAESKAGNCGAVQRENNELVITAGLHECGAKLRVDDDSLIYSNTLFHTPTPNHFGIVRTAGVAIPVECRYKRTHLVSSTSQSHPMSSALWRSAPIEDNFLSERSLDLSEPNEVVAMVASVLSAHQTVPKLFLDRCEATLEPDTAATPTSDLINDWCPAKSNISFLPRADSHVLRIKLNLPSLGPDGGRAKRSMLVRCWMKTAHPVQRKISGNKVCSYVGNSSAVFGWQSLRSAELNEIKFFT